MVDLAILYGDQGRYDDAEELLLDALETLRRTLGDRDPRTIVMMNNVAWFLLSTREPAKPAEALALAREASELTDHGDPSVLDTLALALHRTGDTEQAIEIQTRAIALVPPEDEALRAELEEALARFEAAAAGDADG